MGWKGLWVGALVFAVISLAGCGGSDDPTSSSVPNEGKKEAKVDWSQYPPGPTRQFIVPGKTPEVQTYGWEATAAERREATTLIAAWMRARSAKDFGKECSYFSKSFMAEIAKQAHKASHGKAKNCGAALAVLGPEVSGNFRNTFGDGPVVSLRTDNLFGFAQYHGNDGNNWYVAVAKEDGKWKIWRGKPFGYVE